MVTSDDRNTSGFRQPNNDRNEFFKDIHLHHMNGQRLRLADLNVQKSCNMVELSSNPLGIMNQFTSSNEAWMMSSIHNDVHPLIDYAPPLPPHALLKPLTPYHYFYRVERDNIVQGMASNDDRIPGPVHDFSEKKLRELLDRRWYIDPIKKKRAHRKTLGKLGFEK